MKKTSAVILSVIFLSLAVLGSFGAHEAITHSVSCVGSLAQQTACPQTSGFEFVSFHLDGLRSFSNGVSVTALILAFALGFALLFASVLKKNELFVPFALSRAETGFSPIFHNFQHWLSLFEKRDPAAA